ncbi:AIPR family protein [Desulfosarcina sp. OttesenSCG-928-G10]|nr:AIPR family protein [Desulfosarcina sp. OttesenSCG-928-G10]MDL2321626.1 AIPR family protein [Desulfosarcina sp. OttesenSCG-928-B08]
MELLDFLHQLQDEVKAAIAEQLDTPEADYPHEEWAFAEHVIQHLVAAGMTFESATLCPYEGKLGNARLKITGYALSEEQDQLDLFISLYTEAATLETITNAELKTAVAPCSRFFSRCIDGKLIKVIDPSCEAYSLALLLQDVYPKLDQIRLYVLTDKISTSKNFKSKEREDGKTIKLEVMDIERLFRHTVAGKPRDELTVDFDDVCGEPLPCVYIPPGETDYGYALTVIPGEVLRFLYEKYGARLLEVNVRSFLNFTGKVNKGIRDTLRHRPERFMAYNNGLVIVSDDIRTGPCATGEQGIMWLKGLQIVNGGQTTASLYFTKKKAPDTDLEKVRIPAKIIVIGNASPDSEEELTSAISLYANSQNAIKPADFSANTAFHRELGKIATSVFCPDGTSQWFYERTAGSYNEALAHGGTTPALLKHLKAKIPTSRKITKTDLAKYINAWEKKPHMVALGGQKNFKEFSDTVARWESDGFLPDVTWFKHAIAKAILFKQADKMVAALKTASKISVTAYLISLLSEKLGDRMDLGKIWQEQALSPPLISLLSRWAQELNTVMMSSKKGKTLVEWAKKPECWEKVKKEKYSLENEEIPEIKKAG